METPRVNEEIFLNRDSQGKNSETIIQVKSSTPREKTMNSFFSLFFKALASIESNNILITIGMHNVFSFW